jgi:putative DNA primase/helicase
MTFPEPDVREIAAFVTAIFAHADPGGHVALRAFRDDCDGVWSPEKWAAPKIESDGLNAVINGAVDLARSCATAQERVVFCPPIATFKNDNGAAEKDVRNGVELMIDCDASPEKARGALEAVLGPATVVVASGGVWIDPETGEEQAKLHLHWRLSKPTREFGEHVRLKEARRLAVILAGSDGSAAPLVHPLRWPGSWHRKADPPKLARIVNLRDVEIDLDEAFDRLKTAVESAPRNGKGSRTNRHPGAGGKPDADALDITAALAVIPNDDQSEPIKKLFGRTDPQGRIAWVDWNNVGMAIWRATGGSEAGYAAFCAWSAKSEKFDSDTTRARWEHYSTSPPNSIGAGSLFRVAQQAHPGWRKPSDQTKARARTADAPPEPEVDEAPTPEEPDHQPALQRRAIRVMPGDLAEATEAALQVLASERDPLRRVYVRGGMLVRPTRIKERLNAGGIRRPTNALILRAVDPDWLRLYLARNADWYVIGEKGAHKKKDPPKDICNTVIAAAPWDELLTLSGIIEAPTILTDGTIIQRPGYHAKTGLLFDPGDTKFPTVPPHPTRKQAEAALRILSKPFEKFPFVFDEQKGETRENNPSRSAALSAVLKVLTRRVLRAAPLTALDAPKMASGKTLIATCCSYIACGRTPYLISQVTDPAEDRKRLLSALIENPAVVVVDNAEHPLRSDCLCTALTEPAFTDRLLGVNRNASVSTNCSFFVTGNNLIIAGDLSSRSLKSRIDPEQERPEEREFEVNLHEWVPEHRGELAAAAITIIRAYFEAGQPKQKLPNFARFEDWQRLCRFPLVWLGLADPCATRESVEAKDPEREQLRALSAGWHEQFADERKTVKEAVKDAPDDSALRAAMDDIAFEKGGINARRLGNFISKNERRIEGKLRFQKDGSRAKTAYWKCVEIGGSGGFGGFGPSRYARAPESGKISDLLGENPPNPPNPPSEDNGEFEL